MASVLESVRRSFRYYRNDLEVKVSGKMNFKGYEWDFTCVVKFG